MNNKIIELARQAGALYHTQSPTRAIAGMIFTFESLEKFHALAVAEECFKVHFEVKKVDEQLALEKLQNSALQKQNAELLEALKALRNLSKRDMPKKFDEAMCWIENDQLVNEMVEKAIANSEQP